MRDKAPRGAGQGSTGRGTRLNGARDKAARGAGQGCTGCGTRLHGARDKAPRGSGQDSTKRGTRLHGARDEGRVLCAVSSYNAGIRILFFCVFTGQFAIYLCFLKSLSLLMAVVKSYNVNISPKAGQSCLATSSGTLAGQVGQNRVRPALNRDSWQV